MKTNLIISKARTGNTAVRVKGNPRRFNIRTIEGPTTIESVVADLEHSSAPSEDSFRFFAEEYRPNGRLSLCRGNNQKEWRDVSKFRDIQDPLEAHRAVLEAKREFDQSAPSGWRWWPVYCGSGLGTRSIYYPTMQAALNAIQNALDANLRLCTHDPIREVNIKGGTISMEAHSLLKEYRSEEQFDGLIADINKHRKPGHITDVGVWYAPYLHVVVRDPSIENYPKYARFGASFDTSTSQVMKRGLTFYRGEYQRLSSKIHSEMSKCYGE